ncbi:MAG: NADH-quinone oxidoreductase subunit C [Gammaproteobacteria bacterium]
MIHFEWLNDLLKSYESEHVLLRDQSLTQLAPAHVLEFDAEDWGQVARIALKHDLRWAGMWAEHIDDTIRINAIFELTGDYLITRTIIDIRTPILPSHTIHYPAADRPERKTQDMFGVVFTDHPDTRRWARHQAWGEELYPLRKDFPVAGNPKNKTPPDNNYVFFQAQGSGVYEIPVGPVHAGVIEPGHFRFQAVGEHVLNLEERLSYVHKGTEKIAEGRDSEGLARLAGRVSGDSTVAHTWAACMAMERAAQVQPPMRASSIRGIMCEWERIANHLGDIGAICNDVGFAFALIQTHRLKEDHLRLADTVFGHRFMMDQIVPGGVKTDIEETYYKILKSHCDKIRDELTPLMDIFYNNISLEDRLLGTGVLSLSTAKKLGCIGYVGKASGMPYDVRKDHGYDPYSSFAVRVPSYEQGDVLTRMKVRAEEIYESIRLISYMIDEISETAVITPWQGSDIVAGAEGIGIVDGWRGEIITYIRFGQNGRIDRFAPRDPSWHTWPALEQLIHGNIVPDFPVCNKSVNGSYSGHDL